KNAAVEFDNDVSFREDSNPSNVSGFL
ncbi:MAG: hypothetical protein V7640_2627, partial [Betaproteobacteria bacterium]